MIDFSPEKWHDLNSGWGTLAGALPIPRVVPSQDDAKSKGTLVVSGSLPGIGSLTNERSPAISDCSYNSLPG